MNFTSLRPHLERTATATLAVPEPTEGTATAAAPDRADSVWRDVLESLVASLRECVLDGSDHAELRQRLEVAWSALRNSPNAPFTAEAGRSLSAVLKEYHEAIERGAREQQEAIASVLALLKEALLVVTSRGDRVVESFGKLEASLKTASTITNVNDLRKQVGSMLQFVQKEGVRERRENERVIANLGQRYTAAQISTSTSIGKLPDREQAMEAMTSYGGAENLFGVLVAIDEFEAIRGRYGDPAIADLIKELSGLREKFSASQIRVFRWSPESILFLVQSYRDFTGFKQDMEKAVEPDFEFRLFLGLRLATLNIQLKRLCLPAQQAGFRAAADLFVSHLTAK